MEKLGKKQLSGMNIHYKFYTLEYFLDSMVRLGVESVELWGAYPHQLNKLIDDKSYPPVKDVKRMIEERGLNLVCYTPEQVIYPINIAAKESFIRDFSIRYFRDCLETAAELGTDRMLVTPGWGYFNEPVEEAWARCRESLQILGEHAEKCGIMIALENLRTDESNLVYNLPTLKRMLEEVGHPYVKGMVDTIPMAINGETVGDYLKGLGDDLIHIHFLDGAPRGHLAWGDGILPLDKYMKEIFEAGYQGALSLEITDNRYVFEPDEAVRKCAEAIGAYM
ncbi:sugar phosphate isomerase/epimerase family protein [Harryflintia acetispora]|uniref:Protein FrlC n=1 Tax=Harryflintia acetispora TaxID=1849041 RepID=A0A9X8UL00_9FIRM|nr:TIM barrel protein [Harryflintia acetispora]TCL44747.1 protein FrlC [Harryflintia acetispora]